MHQRPHTPSTGSIIHARSVDKQLCQFLEHHGKHCIKGNGMNLWGH